MNLLLLTVTYYPEKKSASFMLKTLAEELVALNNEVTVITFSSSIEVSHLVEIINGVKLIRIRVSNPGFSRVRRALIELTYSWRIKNLLKNFKDLEFDGVIYYSPTIFFGKAISYIKSRWNIPSYLIVRDLFPDWLVKIGQMNKGFVYLFFKHYERLSFKNASFIGMESKEDITYGLTLRDNKNIPVHHLYNWYSPSSTKYNQSLIQVIDRKKINIIYGGALGVAQDLSGFLEAIELQNRTDIRIIIIGDGEKRLEVEGIINRSNMDIILFPMLERDEYLYLVEQCDLGLVVLDKNLISNNYPAKSFDYMYFSKPILAYMNSENEFGNMIEVLNFGYFVKADLDGSLGSELSFTLNNNNFEEKGNKAKEVLLEQFSAHKAASQILKSLDN